MSLNISRKGRVYVKEEGSFGDAAVTFSATDAIRHQEVGMTHDPTNKVTSKEKKTSPGAATRFTRKTAAALNTLNALIRPSGTINTLPEANKVFKAAFGAVNNVTLSTTVASGGTTTGCTLTSGAGLAAGRWIVLTHAGVKYARRLATADSGTGVVTWAPALSFSPSNGDAVKAGIDYSLTTDLAITLALFHVLPGFKRLGLGIALDKFAMTFNANDEPTLTASGPMKTQLTSGLPSDPGTFTTVGGNPPSGLIGELLIGGTAYLYKEFGIDVTNGMRLRDQEFGNSGLATEAYRASRRDIGLSLKSFAETEATIYDLAEAGTETTLFLQCGRTEGNIIALYCPRVEFKVPTTSDGDEEADWDFRAMALESADGQNDEISLALL